MLKKSGYNADAVGNGLEAIDCPDLEGFMEESGNAVIDMASAVDRVMGDVEFLREMLADFEIFLKENQW